MSTYDWAERECRLACKKENPDFNFDSDDFDYGGSCYKSALKAYKSLCEDGHSGASFGFTKDILIRLMEHKPLTPITDDDFFLADDDQKPVESDEWLMNHGLKSKLQCPRMSSLFRKETLTGEVTYNDNNRAYCVNVESPSDTYYGGGVNIIDELFPITMPYYPQAKRYAVYEQTFLTDRKNGDFDTKGLLYVITPSGKRIDVYRYSAEKDGKWEEISQEEYLARFRKRIDKISLNAARELLWSLISNSSSDEEIEHRETAYKALPAETKAEFSRQLEELCRFFETPENYRYNTFHYRQALCRGEVEKYKGIPQLVEIGEFLQGILKTIQK